MTIDDMPDLQEEVTLSLTRSDFLLLRGALASLSAYYMTEARKHAEKAEMESTLDPSEPLKWSRWRLEEAEDISRLRDVLGLSIAKAR